MSPLSRIKTKSLVFVVVIVISLRTSYCVEHVIKARVDDTIDDKAKVKANSETVQQQQDHLPVPAVVDKNTKSKVTSKHAGASSTVAADVAAATAAGNVKPGDVVPDSVQHDAQPDFGSLNDGAFKRAAIVILGFVALVMIYLAFRTFRSSKNKPQMVRKYGILAHRQDVEMRPLPLDEDDEDDTTVFDASNISAQRLEA